MKPSRIIIFATVLLLSILLLTACMPNPSEMTGHKPSGFLKGIWHGWIAPFSLIVGFFNDTTRIYDPNNTGWGYDFGFYMAIISGFGGLSLARKKREE